MKTILPLVAAMCLLCVAFACVYTEHVRRKKLKMRVRKLYGSRMFEDMMPMLRHARKQTVREIDVDKTGVRIRYWRSDLPDDIFLMEKHGYRYLSKDQQGAMRAVLEECLIDLREAKKYKLMRKRVTLLNGETDHVYSYVMVTSYKNRLSRMKYQGSALTN